VLVLYGTGEGQTNPAGVDGKAANGAPPSLPKPQLPVSLTVGGKTASVLYAGAPGFIAGARQINLRLPPDLSSVIAARPGRRRFYHERHRSDSVTEGGARHQRCGFGPAG